MATASRAHFWLATTATIRQRRVAPVAFTAARVRNRTDGQLYWIIDHGLGNMPAFNGRLTSDELWSVVAFVRQQADQ